MTFPVCSLAIYGYRLLDCHVLGANRSKFIDVFASKRNSGGLGERSGLSATDKTCAQAHGDSRAARISNGAR